MNDWNVSRDRFWGTPIPLIFCKKCGIVPSEEYVKLPDKFCDLKKNQEFFNTKCPKCKKKAIRSTETLDTFFSSSWYLLRFFSPKSNIDPFPKKIQDIKLYIGGKEHNTMHILFLRFIFLFAKKHNYLLHNKKSYIYQLINQGLILGNTRQCKLCKRYLTFDSIECYNCKKTDFISKVEKISKSKNNGPDLSKILEMFNTDVIKMGLLFAGPIRNDIVFSIKILFVGVSRFYNKLQKWYDEYKDTIVSEIKWKELLTHDKIKKLILRIGSSLDNYNFNKVCSGVMELFNYLNKNNLQNPKYMLIVFAILRPLLPQLSFFVLSKFNYEKTICSKFWKIYESIRL